MEEIDNIQGIGLHLDLVLRKIQNGYLRMFEALAVDMTIEQWVILHQVYELGDTASQREIVQLNFRNRATISRVIGGLERKGWLKKTRFKGDQKRFRLQLTSTGQEIFDLVLPHAQDLRHREVDGLTKSELDTFFKVLDRIGGNHER